MSMRVGNKGRVVVPAEVRERHGWGEGTVLIVNDEGLRIAGAGNVWRVLDDAAGIVVGTLDA